MSSYIIRASDSMDGCRINHTSTDAFMSMLLTMKVVMVLPDEDGDGAPDEDGDGYPVEGGDGAFDEDDDGGPDEDGGKRDEGKGVKDDNCKA